MKKFTKQELREQLGMTEENIKLTMDAQRIFPELLTETNIKDFIIDGKILCDRLGIKDDFNTWLLGETRYDKNGKIKSQGKLIKYKCIENTDFITDWDSPNAELSKEEIQNMSPQKRSSYGIKNVIKLNLHTAKKIAMRQNNEQGDLVCDYFIMLEEAIKDKIEWLQIREPEKQGYNNMCEYVNKWCEINRFDNSDDSLSKREANLLNISLTGMSSSDIKYYLGYKDINTREHLNCDINKALYELQLINSSLLMANLDFKTRKQIIEDTCKNKYPHLKITE